MYRFGAAAHAAGLTEGQLRNWLARNDNLWLPSERPAGGWRQFSAHDVIVLSFANELVTYGAKVAEACQAGLIVDAMYKVEIKDPLSVEGPDHVWVVRSNDGGWSPHESEHAARIGQIHASHYGGAVHSILKVDGKRLIRKALGRLLIATKFPDKYPGDVVGPES